MAAKCGDRLPGLCLESLFIADDDRLLLVAFRKFVGDEQRRGRQADPICGWAREADVLL